MYLAPWTLIEVKNYGRARKVTLIYKTTEGLHTFFKFFQISSFSNSVFFPKTFRFVKNAEKCHCLEVHSTKTLVGHLDIVNFFIFMFFPTFFLQQFFGSQQVIKTLILKSMIYLVSSWKNLINTNCRPFLSFELLLHPWHQETTERWL